MTSMVRGGSRDCIFSESHTYTPQLKNISWRIQCAACRTNLPEGTNIFRRSVLYLLTDKQRVAAQKCKR